MSAKPIYQYQNNLRYYRHINALATISNQKPQQLRDNSIQSMHKLRSLSLSFHQQEQELSISQENQKMLHRLLTISKRKKSQYSQSIAQPKISTFLNPARKKRQKMITEMNQRMAQRMLLKQSCLNYKDMCKDMQNYQKLKKAINNNKKVLNTTAGLPLPQISASRVKARQGSRLKSRRAMFDEHENSTHMQKQSLL